MPLTLRLAFGAFVVGALTCITLVLIGAAFDLPFLGTLGVTVLVGGVALAVAFVIAETAAWYLSVRGKR